MMVCDGCGAWAAPIVHIEAQTVRCPECGHVAPRRFLPLFIMTGASGTGKTAVIPALRRLLPDWEVFETDILWDSGGDWQMVFCNWLRIAHSVAQGGRPTMLCGTTVPERIDGCESRGLFPAVHYLALDCDDAVRAARLRARPAWRGCTEEFIAGQQTLAQWLRDNAVTAFDPPLTLVDTTGISVEATARRVRDWAVRPHGARP